MSEAPLYSVLGASSATHLSGDKSDVGIAGVTLHSPPALCSRLLNT